MKSATSITFSLFLAVALPLCLFGALVVGDDRGPVRIEVNSETAPDSVEGRFFLEPRRIPSRERTEPVGRASETPLAALPATEVR